MDQERVVRVINKYREGGRTFLTSPDTETLSDDSVIDITHESLIRLWDTLQDWVAEEAESARLGKERAQPLTTHYQKSAMQLWDS